MLQALLLTLALTGGLFLLSALCRLLLHAVAVHQVGVGTTIVVGQADDLLLPQRVYTSFLQSGLARLESDPEILVLDCGLSEDVRSDCRAVLGKRARVRFVPPENLCEYLVASGEKK